MYKKRKARCGYCWQEGHNRTSCPKMKMEAANGDNYAQRQLERSATKQCSYCRQTDHNKASCPDRFTDERRDSLSAWTALQAAINIIKDKKIANGAFVYGPILHRWATVPLDKSTGRDEANYELGNYVIKDVQIGLDSVREEFGAAFTYDSLVETDGNVYFKRVLPLPFLSKEMQRMPDSVGRTHWFSRNDARYDTYGRNLYDQTFEVLVPATDEEVNKLVETLLAQKPMIVDFEDMKAYNSAKRKMVLKANKESKAKENSEWQD